MKIVKVKSDLVEVELSPSDIGILHFALYDYHSKICSTLKKKKLDIPQQEEYKKLKEKIINMIEIINLFL